MASKEFLEFNEQFPHSKYREIYPQFKEPLDTPEAKDKYQKSKAPINSNIVSFSDLKSDKNRVGWIVPKD